MTFDIHSGQVGGARKSLSVIPSCDFEKLRSLWRSFCYITNTAFFEGLKCSFFHTQFLNCNGCTRGTLHFRILLVFRLCFVSLCVVAMGRLVFTTVVPHSDTLWGRCFSKNWLFKLCGFQLSTVHFYINAFFVSFCFTILCWQSLSQAWCHK